MRMVRNAACAVLVGSLAAVAAPSICPAAPPITRKMIAPRAAKRGDFCDLILQGKPVATFAKLSASIAPAAAGRGQGSLVLKGGASSGDPALRKWVAGSQRGEHQEIKVACTRGGRAAETYDLHKAWASRIANTAKGHGQASVRLTIRYERLSVKLRMS